jgi:signal transduction histidine kinase/ligand-binding sensor domain-containing protein
VPSPLSATPGDRRPEGRRRRLIVATRALLAWLLLPLAAPAVTAERLPLRTYTTDDGLAHSRVRRIVADPRGLLWFCTIDGLSRFDGAEFVTYRTADGIPDPWVTDVLTSRDGTYWVATNEGVVKLDVIARRVSRDKASPVAEPPPRLFAPVAFEGSPTQRHVRVLLEDRAGRIWAGGRGGLSLLDERGAAAVFRPVVPGPAAMVTSLLEGDAGTLWIGTLDGLFVRFSSGRLATEPTAAQGRVRHVRALARDHGGRVWVGHDEGLLVLGPGAGVRKIGSSASTHVRACGGDGGSLRLPVRDDDACDFTMSDGLIDRRVRALAVGSDGHVRVGTVNGVTVVDGAHITNVGRRQGLAEDAINTIAEDREGNLWIGTDASGAVRIAASGLESFFEADGLAHDLVPALLETAAGRVVAVSGAQYTINEFDGRRFMSARFNVPRDLPADRYFSVLRDHLGAWWIGTAAGLYRFPPTAAVGALARVRADAHYAQRADLPSDDLFPLFEDARGDIWLVAQLSDHVRLVRWNRQTDSFRSYGQVDGLPHLAARPSVSRPSIVEPSPGQLFFGFREAGLFAYRGESFEPVLEHGAVVGVGTLHAGRHARVWVIGTDGAARRIDDFSTRLLVSDASLSRSLRGANVRCMVEDREGRFYFCTTRGVIRLDPATGSMWRLTRAEGLAQNEVWSAHVTSTGEVWFGTIAGVSRFDPTRVRPAPSAPRAVITAVHVNGDVRLASEFGEGEVTGLTLAPRERNLAIEFSAISLSPGEGLRYQHRFEGTEQDWSRPSVERVVRFAQLPSGHHRFQVRAVTSTSVVGAPSATVDFVIEPALSQRWQFRSGLLAAVVLIAVAAHRYRVARLLDLERVRMRIAADLHDDIGGSLARIAIQSEVACREAAALGRQPARRLTDIAESARSLLDALGDVVWSVDPRRDDLTSVCRRLREYIDDVFTGTGVRWVYAVPADLGHVRLDPQARRHLFLLLKEGVTNIARHASARHVSFGIQLEGGELRAELRDDGHGFDISAVDAAADQHGILSMRARAEQLGARLAIASSGTGTTIRVGVPLPAIRRRMSMLLPTRLR